MVEVFEQDQENEEEILMNDYLSLTFKNFFKGFVAGCLLTGAIALHSHIFIYRK